MQDKYTHLKQIQTLDWAVIYCIKYLSAVHISCSNQYSNHILETVYLISAMHIITISHLKHCVKMFTYKAGWGKMLDKGQLPASYKRSNKGKA